MKFKTKIFLVIVILVMALLGVVSTLFYYYLHLSFEDQIASKSLVQAKEISNNKSIINGVLNNDIESLTINVQELQKLTDADYITIGDVNGVRIVHKDPEKLGKPMMSDNSDVLIYGRSVILHSMGGLGLAIRGKSPIIYDGKIIGVVSVGYLMSSLKQVIIEYEKPIIFTCIFTILLSLYLSYIISRYIKTSMYGMEPKEISRAFNLKNIVLNNVCEGIIAIDNNMIITELNSTSIHIFGDLRKEDIISKNIITVLNEQSDFFTRRLKESKVNGDLKDEILIINNELYLANIANITDGNGWVISFRRKDDIELLSSQLSQMDQYTDNLRVIQHEYSNKISTIKGLIQLGEYDKAVALISSDSEGHQDFIDFVQGNIKQKIVAGILIGKYSKSKELGLTLELDEYSNIDDCLNFMTENQIYAILGNLIDNAFEATIANPNSNKIVHVLICNANDEILIEVSDTGTGINPTIQEKIYNKGYTTKQINGHGIGLYLTKMFVTQVGGDIMHHSNKPFGTIFTVYLPKKIS